MGSRRSILLILVAGMVACAPAPEVAADYDLVILNGRVMDPETEFDAVSNVGVKGGKIVKITKDEISGKETIDAPDMSWRRASSTPTFTPSIRWAKNWHCGTASPRPWTSSWAR